MMLLHLWAMLRNSHITDLIVWRNKIHFLWCMISIYVLHVVFIKSSIHYEYYSKYPYNLPMLFEFVPRSYRCLFDTTIPFNQKKYNNQKPTWETNCTMFIPCQLHFHFRTLLKSLQNEALISTTQYIREIARNAA